MKTITAALLSIGLLLAGGNAYADDMTKKKDSMAKDEMKKDSMKKDTMKKDTMGKEEMKK